MNETKTRNRSTAGVFALLLTLAVLVSSFLFPVASAYAANNNGKLNIMVMSDTHVLAPSLVGNTEDFSHDTKYNRKMFKESSAVMEAQLKEVERQKPDVLLISGDLTKDGELESHKYFAKRLEETKKKVPNLKIYVTNGNHDINNSKAKNYNTGGAAKAATKTSPADFRNTYSVTYKDSSIIAKYTATTSGKSGQLSYAARPKPGYTVLVIDTGRYSADNTSNGKDEHQTSGQISKDLEAWVLKQIRAAKDRGDTIIGMEHHNIVPHFSWEPEMRPEFLINDYSRLSKEYADAGLHFMFSGHMHSQDVAKLTTSSGNVFYDVETGAGVNYSSPLRQVSVERKAKNGSVTETMTAATIDNLSASYTDTDGSTVQIDNIKTYGEKQIISKTLAKQCARVFMNSNMKLEGKTYSAKDYDAKVNEIMDNLFKIKVSTSENKNLYDYVTYAYLHYLAGEDGQAKPAWFKEADRILEDGTLLSYCLNTISNTLVGFPEDKAYNIWAYLFFPAKYFKNHHLSTPKASNHALQIQEKGLDVYSDEAFTALNNFYKSILKSVAYDSNFKDDKNFTITVNS